MAEARPDPFKGPVVTYGRAAIVPGAAPRAVLGEGDAVVLTLHDIAEVAAWANAVTETALALHSEATLAGFPGADIRVFPGADGTSVAINATRETDLSTLAMAFYEEEGKAEEKLAEVIALDDRRPETPETDDLDG